MVTSSLRISPDLKPPKLLDQGDGDFDYKQLAIRGGKGEKDRVTMLPQCVVKPLREHLLLVKQFHEQDLCSRGTQPRSLKYRQHF